ncbi:multicopper oxidase family protein [Pseudonocardia sp. CA-107938]|uniref:multicopper oxidase family protein n=1 Tax=Pseudonocardia sp. CA-107938 TaxID=3240021 RepID=UPI003D93E9CF
MIVLDHAVAALTAVGWFAAGVAAAGRRAGLARALLVGALVVTMLRVGSAVLLAGRGWWFVQEKVLLGLPMLVVAAVSAAAMSRRADGVVAVFAAAYASVAGFAVSFLAGYPLTLDVALLAIAAVITASLLTARALSAPSTDAAVAPVAGLSRRRFLGATAGVAAGSGAALVLFRSPAPAEYGGGALPAGAPAVSVTDLRGPVEPAPGGVRRRHVLTARRSAVQPAPGREVDAWTFDGTVPGPTITATQGDLIEVRLVNHDIDGGVTLHWHGYDVPCGEDGAEGITQHPVGPGGEFDYRFRADQVGTYWYHTHFASHIGVQRGLFGALIVRPREDAVLDVVLTVHTFDGVPTLLGGPELVAPAGRDVRVRLINSDSDPHRFALAGAPFRVTAVDGRDLNGPGEIDRTALRLAASGRYDLRFTMPSTPVAVTLDENDAIAWIRPHPDAPTSEADVAGWPELDLLTYGTPAAVPLRDAPADRHFTMVLDRGLALVDGSPTYGQTVNGRGHPNIPDQVVAEGDVVRFTIVNRGLDTHPWHLHGHAVLIVSRNGVAPTGSPLWMDTVEVRPGDVWEVAFRATNPGIWMNHCHNLPHVQQGMMTHLRYAGVTSPFQDSPHHH